MVDTLLNKIKTKEIKIYSKFKKYSVFFNSDLKNIKKNFPKDSIVIADKKVKSHFQKNDKFFYIEGSEKLKSFENLNVIIKKILKLNITKSTTLIAIGGGTVQDACSFISSILFRGIKWIFIPTTLLSQCDSCIGGKTSINFYGIKNQIGNFYPPNEIYINLNFIKNQTKKNLLSGLGEMSHYYFVSGKKDFNFFKKHASKALENNVSSLTNLVYGSLIIKKKYIEKDEFDTGERLILNYGHSFGHAIEKASNNLIPHGIAVANGMKIANYISYKKRFLNLREYISMNKTLNMITSSKELININPEIMMKALEKDKKNDKKSIRVILTKGIGKMFMFSIDRRKKKVLKNLIINYLKEI
jgi:3-dehydroquinate synthase